MKRIYATLMLVAAIWLSMAGNSGIAPGTHFFDGQVLYEAEQRYGQLTCLTGVDAQGQLHELVLMSYDIDCYLLCPDQASHSAPYGVKWGTNVYLHTLSDGTRALAVMTNDDDCVATVLKETHNPLDECLREQQWAEQQELGQLADGWLLNQELASIWDTSVLVALVDKMEKRELTDLEYLNYKLLQAVVAMRWQRSLALDTDGADAADGAPDATDREEQSLASELAAMPCYRVHNADEFIRALGSDRQIIVEKDAEINLSRVLDNFEYFSTPGFKMDKYLVSRKYAEKTSEPTVMSEFCSDGSQLSLIHVNNLYIHGRKGAKIVVEPRRAFVLNLVACDNVWLSNLTMGHTEGGVCEGGVVGAELSSNIVIKDCDLYGCGTYGLSGRDSESIYMSDSNIHDCTYGIMELLNCNNVAFEGCDFFRNKEFDLVEAHHCSDLFFADCRFYQNSRNATLFAPEGCEVTLDNCVIYHPKELVGNSSLVHQANCWQLEGDDNDTVGPPSRGCGPK